MLHSKSQHCIEWGRLKVVPLRSKARHVCQLSPSLFSIVLKIVTRTIRKQKEIKETQIGLQSRGSQIIPVVADIIL